jgi:phospholipid/cholesterol/gamma-HCH transport system substrate-binding protein
MPYQKGDTLPTQIVPGLIDNLQTGILANLDSLLAEANTLLASLNDQMSEGSLYATLQNIEQITQKLAISSKDLRALTHNQLPTIMDKADATIQGLNDIVDDVKAANIQGTVGMVDSTLNTLNAALQSQEGTVGMLLNDKTLYDNLNNALQDLDQALLNVDSIMVSIKSRPFIQKKLAK